MGMWWVLYSQWCMSLWSVSHTTCYNFGPSMCSFEIELSIHGIMLSVEGSKEDYHLSFYQSEIRCHVSGQIIRLTTSHSFLSCCLDVWFWWQMIWLKQLLLSRLVAYNESLWPCSLPFYVQVRILIGSYSFFYLCLDFCRWIITLHYHP